VVTLDDRGFILTGRDLPPEAWALRRPPLAFETSLPGVFAAGDVRYGSVKRVAGAVGEGSVAVGSVHQYVAQLGDSARNMQVPRDPARASTGTSSDRPST
jgi:thioredoxin reductase (NADPH)